MYVISGISGGRRSSSCNPCYLDLGDTFRIFPSSSTAYMLRNSSREASGFATANVDWKETPEAHVFKADLPGLKKEEVKVEVEEGRVLKISGEISREPEEKNHEYHHRERSSGKFLRRFRLPEDVKLDEIQASMENGVLTVIAPKRDLQKKPHLKAVEISG